VLRIRDVYPGSRINPNFSIPDPNFFHPGSEFFPSRILGPYFSIQGPGSEYFYPGSRIRIKKFKHFNPKIWFLSSRKYDLGFSSRIGIPNPDPDFLPIPDPGSGSATLRVRFPTLQYLSLKFQFGPGYDPGPGTFLAGYRSGPSVSRKQKKDTEHHIGLDRYFKFLSKFVKQVHDFL
jgi:hypothetical protein